MGVVTDERARDLVARSGQLPETAGISLEEVAAEVGCSKAVIRVGARPGDRDRAAAEKPDMARKWLAILTVLDATAPCDSE